MALTKILSDGLGTGVGGKVLQVVQTVKTDTFSHATSTLTAITGLSVNITPSSTNNKILVQCTISAGANNANSYGSVQLFRDGSVVSGSVGDSAGSKQQSSTANLKVDGSVVQKTLTFTYLDSPATTSQVTYQPYIQKGAETVTLYVNQAGGEADNANHTRSMSSITVMEIEG
jgi:hypothetical protein